MKTLACCLASVAACITPCLSSQEPRHSDSNLLGEWRGTSVCQVRESSCHDENSLYHVAHIAEKPNWFSLKGDKIVAGKLITMGTVECHYDSATSDLTCDLPKGLLHFTIQGNKMEGTMTLPDGTLWRKLNLTKAPSTKMSGKPTNEDLESQKVPKRLLIGITYGFARHPRVKRNHRDCRVGGIQPSFYGVR